MLAIQDEQEWWNTVDGTLAHIQAFKRGEMGMPEVWYEGISALGWPVEAGDASWRLAQADAIFRISELSWSLDHTVAAIVSGDVSAGELEEGEAMIGQVKEELLSMRSG